MERRPLRHFPLAFPNPAFTLIEMLVVIAIIGVLAALLMPSLTKAMDSAKTTLCVNNARQIGICATNYADDNNYFLPTQSSWRNSAGVKTAWVIFLSRYTDKPLTATGSTANDAGSIKNSVFQCPVPYPKNTWIGNSYQINTRVVSRNSNKYDMFARLPRVKEPGKTLLLGDGDGNGSHYPMDLYYHNHSRHSEATMMNTLCIDGSCRLIPEVIVSKILKIYSYSVTAAVGDNN